MSQSYPYGVGISNVGSYQVSGIPFVTGTAVPVSSGTPVQIVFPEVTQRIVVANTGLADLRVGFSANGVKNTNNYYVVHLHDATVSAHYETIDLRVKVSSIFLLSNDAATATSARIAAELTNISTSHLLNSGPSGSSWSGSVGVG